MKKINKTEKQFTGKYRRYSKCQNKMERNKRQSIA